MSCLHGFYCYIHPHFFFHFNIDVHGRNPIPSIEIYKLIVDGDEQGRGSMVFFNEATMFYGSETGHDTLKAPKEAGGSGSWLSEFWTGGTEGI